MTAQMTKKALHALCSTRVKAGAEKCWGPRAQFPSANHMRSHQMALSWWCWYSNYLEWINRRTLERKANWQRDRGVEERERERERESKRDGVGEMLWGVMVAWRLLSRRRWVLESFGISNVLYLCWFSERGFSFVLPFSPQQVKKTQAAINAQIRWILQTETAWILYIISRRTRNET